MKKVLSLILVLALAASMLCTAFAEDSKTRLFDVTKALDENGNEVNYTEAETEVEVVTSEQMATAITNAIANAQAKGEELDIDVDPSKLVVLQQMDYDADSFPVTFNFVGEGTEDAMIYVFVLYDEAEDWELVYAGLGGEFQFVLEAKGTYAVVTDAE